MGKWRTYRGRGSAAPPGTPGLPPGPFTYATGPLLQWTWTDPDPGLWRVDQYDILELQWVTFDIIPGVNRDSLVDDGATYRVLGLSAGGQPVTQPGNEVYVFI